MAVSYRSTTTTVQQPQIALKESIERTQKYERKGKKWQELTAAVTCFIAKDNLPIKGWFHEPSECF